MMHYADQEEIPISEGLVTLLQISVVFKITQIYKTPNPDAAKNLTNFVPWKEANNSVPIELDSWTISEAPLLSDWLSTCNHTVKF